MSADAGRALEVGDATEMAAADNEITSNQDARTPGNHRNRVGLGLFERFINFRS